MTPRTDYRIALNFFPLTVRGFSFNIYRAPYREGDTREDFPGCKRRRLPGDGDAFSDFWVSFEPREGFDQFIAMADTNLYVTVDALFHMLCHSCQRNLEPSEFQVEAGFRRRVVFVLQEHPGLGHEIAWLEPYNLRSRRQFGFLADFSFDAPKGAKVSRRMLQLSLSLDKAGQNNRNYYIDRFAKLQNFVNTFYGRIFPLLSNGRRVTVDTRLYEIKSDTLEPKQYRVGGDYTSVSPFVGIREHGPLQSVDSTAKLYFIYRPGDKSLSYDLFRALRGDTFNTFLGMQKMFEFAMNNERVGGVPLAGFDRQSLDQTCRAIERDIDNQTVVPIVITPFHHDGSDESNRQYYLTKHVFLQHGFPTQFVSTGLLESKNTMKWSASNIALGVFAKMGGRPWIMVPRTQRCLIVGLGQAHRTVEGRIERYFAYSVLTDASGLYEEVRILGESHRADDFMREFKHNLASVLEDYRSKYQTLVIHTTFKIRRDELNAVKEVLTQFAGESDRGPEFIVMKFNDENKFFGYAPTNNSMVPYESSYIRLSRTEYLLWFEGLQRNNPTVSRRIERPVLVEFVYQNNELSDARMRDCLQDALNLSGANWRGFNAKSLPISIYYAQLIARFVRESEALGLESLQIETIRPWFL